jgi:hypothetical protein
VTPEVQQSGIFVLAIFLAILAERGRQWLRRRAARGWPCAEGYVETAGWRQPNSHSNRYFVAELAYSYVIGGQFYAGYYRRSFSRAAAAEAFVESIKSRPLQVRYQPGQVSRSLLLDEDVREFNAAVPQRAPV